MKKISHLILVAVMILFWTTNYMGVAYAQTQGQLPAAPERITSVITPSNLIESGPNGGTINDLAMDPSSPTTLYAASNYGVFKSTNNGNSWSLTGLTSRTVLALAINPVNTANIFAATYAQGFYSSTDGGVTWTASPDAYIQDKIVYTLVIDPTNPNNLYAGGRENNVDGTSSGNWGGGAFKSTNGGVSWQAINNGLPEGWVYSMAINPNVPNIIYAGTHTQGVYKSVDGGASWNSRNSGLVTTQYPSADNLKIRSIAMNPNDPNNLLVGLWAGVGMFETSNGAENGWAFAGKNVNSAPVRSVAFDPSSQGRLYAGLFSGGPLQNAFGGYDTNWGPFPTQPQGLWGYFSTINVIRVNLQSPGTIFFGSTGAGVFRSTDGGITWQAANQGLSATTVTSISPDPSNPSILFASTNGTGVFKSTDNGLTWSTKFWPGFWDQMLDVVVDPLNPNTLYAANANNGITASYDGGISWNSINSNLPTTAPVAIPSNFPGSNNFNPLPNGTLAPASSPLVTAVAASPTSPVTTLYAGTWGHGIYQSVDSGNTWKLVDGGNAQVTSIHVYPNDPFSVIASSANDGVILILYNGAAYIYSTNGLPSVDVLSTLVDPTTFGTLYAGTVNGVYISPNNGSSWSYYGLSSDPINAMAIDPIRKTTFYAGTQVNGLVRTDDSGKTWYSAGVAGGAINALLMRNNTDSYLFAGVDGGGVFRVGYSTIILNLFIKVNPH